ncbi:hypothetical protein ACFWPA_05040 [Rhodococcus sp. NPDC058505]|uniref:hypothetical protein n=1 Tax=unclassified Rhodococcus (in: high G+C Gram-positive bacteria) TaxID=192944 RepID=UPI003654DB6E
MPVPTAADLTDIAFGPTPGAVPGQARSARDRWLRAVALGGQGRYAAARTELAAVRRERPGAVLASLAASTEASLLRQLGWHRLASAHDGRALAVIGDDRTPLAVAARCDALTGLAADALGCGRTALGFRLLERCADLLDGETDESLLRQRIRLHWVSAEMLLVSGDPDRGRRHAAAAVDLAAGSPSARHQVKSDLLLAAAVSAGPDPAAAVDPARRVLARCREHDLVPLEWAAAMLLGGVAPGPEADLARQRSASRIIRAGGRFRET